MKPSATIIGGSMAGLFAATALSKKGWDISVHEKVPVPLSGRGAGIATYDELADLVFKATNNNNVLGTTAKSRVSLDINGNIINSYDYPQVYTSWQYLFSILREQISNDDYFMGDDCIKIEQNEDKAIAFFDNGKKKETDLIIVANGIKSELRTYVDNKAYPQYAGYVGWRGVVNEEEISKKSLETLSNYFIVVLPYNQQIASYPIAGEGKNPFKIGERRINWIWYKPVPQNSLQEILLGKSGQQFEDGIPPNEIREEIVNDLFKEAEEKLPPQLVELVKITKQPLIQPIFDLQSIKMKNGRVVTIGDAAFTARPHVGMGVTKAAMDAFTLSEYLEDSSNLDDLDKWEHSRLKESQFIVNRSRKLGQYLSIPNDNENLIMPNVQNVLQDTAISLYDIEDYKI
jgi:2-polyprenyl-6-methoxyphenol hydroxylase-like FAD-dependent oxidoreductase|tara:strand:- start:1313 stop:2518 length:1206 start_codon:yes stop_codon:yes gene_type:complete